MYTLYPCAWNKTNIFSLSMVIVLFPVFEQTFSFFNFLGVEVEYPIDVSGDIKAGKCTIRCLLICWTGDYPAQCQIGKFSCKGTYGCRVDKCKGKVITFFTNKTLREQLTCFRNQ